jgi:hypothetical protein
MTVTPLPKLTTGFFAVDRKSIGLGAYLWHDTDSAI